MMAVGVSALIVFAALAFGGVESWARGVIQIAAALVGALWLLSHAPDRVRVDRLLVIPAGLFVLLVLLQVAPLPPALLRLLSPATARLYDETVPGFREGSDADPAGLPAWLLARFGSRMPAVAGGDKSLPAAMIPARVDSTDFAAPLDSWRTLSIEPFATREELVMLLSCVAVFFAAGRVGRSAHRMEGLARSAVLTGCLVSTIGIVQKLTWNGRIYWVREGTYKNVFGPFVNRNSYAAFACVVLPLAVCLTLIGLGWWREKDSPTRRVSAIVWGTCALVIGAGIVASRSRGGLVAAVVGLIALPVLLAPARSPWRRRAAVLSGAATGAACLAAIVWGGVLSGGSEPGRLAPRLDVWNRAMRLVAEHAALGTGLGTFRYAFLAHAPPEPSWWTNAHNEYLEVICDTGLIGAGLVLLVFIGWVRAAVRPASASGMEARAVRAGMLAGLAALMLHASANADLRVPAIALLVAAFAGAVRGGSLRDLPDDAEARWSGNGRPTARSMAGIGWGLAALALVAVATYGGVSRVAAFRARYLAGEALVRIALDESWDRLAAARFWQPADPATWRQMATVARQAIGFDASFREFDRLDSQERLGTGLGAAARALAMNPAHATVWMELAELYAAQGVARAKHERMYSAGRGTPIDDTAPGLDPEDRVAVAAALMAAERQPEMFLPHEFLARIYWRSGLVKEAAAAIRRSFSLMPLVSVHDALEEEGLTEALSDAILAGLAESRTGPLVNDVSGFRGEAELLERLGRLPEAIAAWEKAGEAAHGSLDAESRVRIARMQQAQGRYRESIGRLEHATADRGDPRWEAEAFYFTGRAYAHLGDHRRAMDWFARYVERRPDVSAGWQALGKAMEALGDVGGAERTYRAAVERFPDDPVILGLLVRLLERQGRTNEARPFSDRLNELREEGQEHSPPDRGAARPPR